MSHIVDRVGNLVIANSSKSKLVRSSKDKSKKEKERVTVTKFDVCFKLEKKNKKTQEVKKQWYVLLKSFNDLDKAKEFMEKVSKKPEPEDTPEVKENE